MIKLFLLAAALGAHFSSQASAALAESDREFLDSLRHRRLARLLEIQVSRLLARNTMDIADRLSLTLELSGLMSERGSRAATATERELLWSQADQLLDQLFLQSLGSGQAPLLRYRWAGLLITRSQRMHDLSLAVPQDAAVKAAACKWADAAIEQLRTASSTAEKELSTRDPNSKPAPQDLKWNELSGLVTASRFRLGQAYLALARCAQSEGQRDANLKLAEPLIDPVAKDGSNPAAQIEARFALADLYRVGGRRSHAIELLSGPSALHTQGDDELRSRLLLARVLIENGEPERGLKILEGSEAETPAWAEWQFATFEALWKSAAKTRAFAPGEANDQRRRAITILDDLAIQHGNYWNLRGQALIAEALPSDFQSDDISILERYAKILRQQNRLDDAIATYDRAQELAETAKETSVATRLAFEGALTLVQAGQYELAANRLLQLAERYPKDDRAPRALVAAAYALARNYQKGKANDLLVKYHDVLRKHLESYADDPTTAPEVHWMLAELLERQKNWDEALSHYQEVPPEDRRFAVSLEASAGIIHDQLLEKINEQDPATIARVNQAISFLERISKTPPASLTASEQGKNALAIARFVLSRLLSLKAIARGEEAVSLLQSEVVNASGLKPVLRARAWSLLLHLQLEHGKIDDAIVTVENGFPDLESNLIKTIQDMDPAVPTLSKAQRAARIRIIEAANRRLLPRADRLPDADRRALRLQEAKVFGAKGDTQNELRLLATLRTEFPRDRQIAVAAALSEYRAGLFTDSLKSWDRLSRNLPRGSEDWLGAIYHMIASYQKLGKAKEAVALYKTTTTLYPDLPTAELKAKYQALGKDLGITTP